MKRRQTPAISGSILIETAITLPFFLAGVLLLIWMGEVLNARSALTSAVQNSIRLAATRAVVPGAEYGPLTRIVIDFLRVGEPSAIMPFLATPERRSEYLFKPPDGEYYKYVSLPTLEQPLMNIPPQYSYALIYVYQQMSLSYTGKLSYPCDPYASDGAGCMRCHFVNPMSFTPVPFTPTDAYLNGVPPGSSKMNWEVSKLLAVPSIFALECSFRPSNLIIDTLADLFAAVIGSVPTSLVLTAHASIDEFPGS